MKKQKNSPDKLVPSRKKEILTLITIFIVIIPLPVFYSIYLTSYLKTPVIKTSWVSWYGNPSNEVYIGWETSENSTCVVKYGKTLDSLDNEIQENASSCIHIVNLTNLEPDTKYYYKITIDGEIYSAGEFRTAPATGMIKPFTFCLFSDTQQKFGPGWHERTAYIMDDKNYTFIAEVGDFVEDGKKAEWNDFFSHAARYLDTIPIVPVRGNHDKPRDLDDDGKYEYYFEKYFPQTVDNITGTNKYDKFRQFYFSFNWSNVHFQILHFPEVDIDDFDEPNGISPKDYYQAFTQDHIEWIKQDLKNAQNMSFRITLFHCPITGAGFYGPNFVLKEQLLPILFQYNVTVTVHGHAHHFERGTLKDEENNSNKTISYFIVGCGGGLTDVGLRPVEETDVVIASPCYIEVYVSDNSLNFLTRTFEGTIVDNFTIYELKIE
ncbi:MAG: metallophosphoesterase family protein [Candidatus Helarchaeales archaeon]